jgi:hypothetical protein
MKHSMENSGSISNLSSMFPQFNGLPLLKKGRQGVKFSHLDRGMTSPQAIGESNLDMQQQSINQNSTLTKAEPAVTVQSLGTPNLSPYSVDGSYSMQSPQYYPSARDYNMNYDDMSLPDHDEQVGGRQAEGLAFLPYSDRPVIQRKEVPRNAALGGS